jgi:hypothetical protein
MGRSIDRSIDRMRSHGRVMRWIARARGIRARDDDETMNAVAQVRDASAMTRARAAMSTVAVASRAR